MNRRTEDLFGSLLPRVGVEVPGSASRSLSRRLRAVESRDVTYIDEGWPVFWEEARGANVRDADGNVFLDLTGAFGVGLLGHAHPSVVAAVRDQAGHLMHGMGDIHPPAIKLALLERLAELSPWDDARTILGSSGSEAVEAALKTAFLATGRPGILAFEGSYHGLTVGSLAATERDHFRGRFTDRLYEGVAFAPFPEADQDGLLGGSGPEALVRVASILEGGAPNGDPIGAILVEPVQGRAGVRVPPPGFMAELGRLADSAGVVLIADEVFTGSGRCGDVFSSARVGLTPDIVCLGKALGGGMPLSACIGRAEVMDAWPESTGEAIHTSTFLGHPVACAAALAVLRMYEEEGTLELVEALGGQLLTLLRARLGNVATFREARGVGMLLGVELVGRDGAPPKGAGVRLAERLLSEGVLVLPAGLHGHVLEFSPSAYLTDEQTIFAVDAVGRAMEAM